jgi:glyoxylase-like metal-dependent hydrolase (beta-lactamase superfamily II)
MFLKRFVVGRLDANCYLIACEESKKAVVVDPGSEGEADLVLDILKKKDFMLKYIINTHGHSDHIGGNRELKSLTSAKILIHELDAEMLVDAKKNLSFLIGKELISPPADQFLKEGDEITFGSLKLKIIHTPGHTPGGICLVLDDIVFTGDTLFAGGIGRTDLPGGSYDDIQKSIKDKLLKLGDDKIIYPGHGPSSTIGKEKKGYY